MSTALALHLLAPAPPAAPVASAPPRLVLAPVTPVTPVDRPAIALGPDADGVFRRAVVAVDFGLASVRAAAVAHALLAPGGMMTLVHVRARPEPGQPAWDAWDADARCRAAGLLQRLAVALRHGTTGCDECGAGRGRQDVTVGAVTLVGDPATETLDYAARVGADLVAVGTRGRTGVSAEVVRGVGGWMPGCSVMTCGAPV